MSNQEQKMANRELYDRLCDDGAFQLGEWALITNGVLITHSANKAEVLCRVSSDCLLIQYGVAPQIGYIG